MPDSLPVAHSNHWLSRLVKQKQPWLKKRFPLQQQATLNLQRIFVLPTLSSLALLGAVMILLLMAINFQSALIYGLGFWLLALLVVAIFFTYRNLSGLTITPVQSQACFAGEKLLFELAVSCAKKQSKQAIYIGWKGIDVAEVNLQKGESQNVQLSVLTRQRGVFPADRLHIQSRYPTGLVVAWSYAQLDMKSVVYPVPRLQAVKQSGNVVADSSEQGAEIARGTTDFGGVREYRTGDSPRHIHWKSYARTGALHTKTFVDYATQERWLDWHDLPIPGIEDKLSHLCARILQCHEKQLEYGLRIPGVEIQPATGEAHKHRCLHALATYGLEDV